MIKRGRSTNLAETGFVDESARERLAALSVTSAEELYGLVSAQPETVSQFLGDVDIDALRSELAQVAPPPAGAGAEAEEVSIAFGAGVPPEIDVPDRIDDQYFEEEILPAAAEATPVEDEGIKVDLRSCMGPIRYQGDRPTCVAHAVSAVIECLRSRQSPGSSWDLSEQFSYWSAKRADGDEEDGTYVRTGLDCATADGICNETSWGYETQIVAGNQGQGPPPDNAVTEAATQKIATRKDLAGVGSEAVRQALDAGEPVALAIQIWEDWTANPAIWNLGTIPIPVPDPKKSQIGHAMCAVGYGLDNDYAGNGYFILRNSWGEDFASRSLIDAPGHALLPFLYFDKFGSERFGASL